MTKLSVQGFDAGLRHRDSFGQFNELGVYLLELPSGRGSRTRLSISPWVGSRFGLLGAGLPEHGLAVKMIVPASRKVFFVRPGKVVDPLTGNFDDSRGQFAHEPPIVGHEYKASVVSFKCGDQGLDGFEVEVVGGLIQNQNVWAFDDMSSENEPGRFTTRQRFQFFLRLIARKKDRGQLAFYVADTLGGTERAQP